MTDFVFEEPPAGPQPIDLVFGATSAPPSGNATIEAALILPGPEVHGAISIAVHVIASTTIAGPTIASTTTYVSNAARPTVGKVSSAWQLAQQIETPTATPWQEAQAVKAGASNIWTAADRLEHGASPNWTDANRVRNARTNTWQDGQGVRQGASPEWQEGVHTRRSSAARWQDGVSRRMSRRIRWQDATYLRNSAAVPWQKADVLSKTLTTRFTDGVSVSTTWRARFQEAMRPPNGVHPIVPPKPDEPCYTPPRGDAVALPFADPWLLTTDLVFFCENHPVVPPDPGATVVVPIQKVYLVLNSASLTNVTTGASIPTLSMSMTLDVDSWTWTLNASVPGAALSVVEPDSDGTPVEVDAFVNGAHYRFFIEGISRDRTFGKSALALTGRGKTAALDAPYAPTMNFTNTVDRTAQQLVADILTDNGVPMGWDVTWNPEDWTVPAGVFSFQGTYIGAINAIAAACGGYVQPHPTAQAMSVLLRYPVLPWAWADATPDFELPSAVAQRESITWAENARYNRVFVQGQQKGVQGIITRDGTAGDLAADTITDSLITAGAAARQRGESILAKTGRIATVGLRMPVLSSTGIIPPGKLIRYVDGGVTRLGMSRAVSVDVGLPEIWQTISVETHV